MAHCWKYWCQHLLWLKPLKSISCLTCILPSPSWLFLRHRTARPTLISGHLLVVWWQLGLEATSPPHPTSPAKPVKPLNHSSGHDRVRRYCSTHQLLHLFGTFPGGIYKDIPHLCWSPHRWHIDVCFIVNLQRSKSSLGTPKSASCSDDILNTVWADTQTPIKMTSLDINIHILNSYSCFLNVFLHKHGFPGSFRSVS